MVSEIVTAVKTAWRQQQKNLSPRPKDAPVPSKVHFIFGLKEQTDAFPFAFFLNIISAAVQIAPDEIVMSYHNEPEGIWWKAVKELCRMKLVEIPTHTVYGAELKHFAHRADIVRLNTLLEEGGIYFDIDVIIMKPFDDLRVDNPGMVMGEQLHPHDLQKAYGLCNAVMLSAPNSSFVKRWMTHYKDFKDGEWDAHSVALPIKLARRHPGDIKVLERPNTFFLPLYTEGGLQELFIDNYYDISNNYASHLWDTFSYGMLRGVTPSMIVDDAEGVKETTYMRMVRQGLPKELRDTLHAATKGAAEETVGGIKVIPGEYALCRDLHVLRNRVKEIGMSCGRRRRQSRKLKQLI